MSFASRIILLLAGLSVLSVSITRASSIEDAQVIHINVYCSTCDHFLRCQSGETRYTLYRLRAKNAWGQIATIWDYFISPIREKKTDERPLAVYVAESTRKYLLEDKAKAKVDLAQRRILLPTTVIDMRQGEWLSATGVSQGQCELLPPREGYRFVRELLGRPLAIRDDS